ncbi:MAG: AbrB/MazE/SpoVT family DNA-binding domain-containing protein [Nitrososphaeria archaeon]
MGNKDFLVVGKNGKIVLPKDVRSKLNILEGSKLKLTITENKIILEKVMESTTPSAPYELLYMPEITKDVLTGEELHRDFDKEARLMKIPVFANLAKRGFFIMSEKNRALAFGFKTVDEAIRHYLNKGVITKDDLERNGIQLG